MRHFDYSKGPGEWDSISVTDDFLGGYRTFTFPDENDDEQLRSLIGDADYGVTRGNTGGDPGILPGEAWLLSYELSASRRNFDNFVFNLVEDSVSPDTVFRQSTSRLSETFSNGLTGSFLVTYDMVEDSFRGDIQAQIIALDDSTGNMFLSYQAVRVKREAQTTAIFSVDDDSGENFD